MPRSVLITGCSDGGLGAALAVAFHQKGYRVLATARNPNKMADLKSKGIETLALDVLSDDSLTAAVKQVSDLTNGSLDILVNNAGAGYSMPVIEADITEIQKVFELNVFSLVRTSKAFFPLLRNAANGALLVNHTSSASVLGLCLHGAYNASKAAAASLSDAMRLELKAFNIKVIDMKTGVVASNFFENTPQGKGARLPPDSLYEVARSEIETTLRGELGVPSQSADVWAANVVNDLSKSNPPSIVWRGSNASKVWLGTTLLPHGTFDGQIKKLTKLDVFERRYRDARANKA